MSSSIVYSVKIELLLTAIGVSSIGPSSVSRCLQSGTFQNFENGEGTWLWLVSFTEKHCNLWFWGYVDLLNHQPAGLMGSFWSDNPHLISCSSSMFVNSLLPNRSPDATITPAGGRPCITPSFWHFFLSTVFLFLYFVLLKIDGSHSWAVGRCGRESMWGE